MPKFYQPSKDHQLESPEEIEAPEIENDNNDNLVRTLISWRAASRPYRKKGRSYYTTVATLIILVSMIAILLGETLLIAALFAFGFVIYVLNFVPPEDIDYKISTQGITISTHFYHWQELDSFWFSEKEGHQVLNILTNIRFPGMLIMLLDNVDEEQIKKICARYLPFHEIPPKTMMDRWSESLTKHFPLENPNH